MFILLTTPNQNLIQKLNKSTMLPYHSKVNESGVKETWLFKSETKNDLHSIISKRSVNDLNDYSHESIQNNLIKKTGIPDARSILSVAYCTQEHFICQTDIWGVFPFFYSQTNDHFIVSDNLFLIAHLLNSSFSEPGLYETLFFTKPKNQNTFYTGISATLPGQNIVLDYSTGKTFISQPADLFSLLNEPSSESSTEKYNDIVKAGHSFPEIHISISAGSDSTTLLSALLFNKFNPVCHSWGNDQYLELQLISRNIKKLGLNWMVTSFERMFEQYREKNKKSMFVTNGNYHTLHHACYYSLNQNIHLFEGYLGSELTKGELSDGMYTPVMKDILLGGKTIKEAIKYHFSELCENEFHKFEEYILDNYGNALININTDAGFKSFKKHLFSFVPSKIFSPILHLAISNDIKLYWPNFDIRFLRTVYTSGYGLMNMVSLRNDFSEQKALQPLYLLNKFFKSSLMRIPLDRNVAFEDVGKPEFQYKIYKILNRIRKKISIINKELILDQVDYRKNKDHLSIYINESSDDWISTRLSCAPGKINSPAILRSIFIYAMIQDIDDCY